MSAKLTNIPVSSPVGWLIIITIVMSIVAVVVVKIAWDGWRIRIAYIAHCTTTAATAVRFFIGRIRPLFFKNQLQK